MIEDISFTYFIQQMSAEPALLISVVLTLGVIFVNGCFWHKHDCPRFVWPSSNEEYWIPKIQRNVERDEMNTRHLISLGWNVLVVWECQLKKKAFEHTMSQLESDIRKGTEKHE